MKKTLATITFFTAFIVMPAWGAWLGGKIQLNLYPEPDLSADPVFAITTGTSVEVLQRQGELAQVRLEDGTEGWVEQRFISEEAPAVVQLQQVTAERDRLRRELQQAGNAAETARRLQQQLTQANNTINTLRSQQEGREQEAADEAATEIERQQEALADLKTRLERSQEKATALQNEVETLKSRAATQKNTRTPRDLLRTILWVLLSMLIAMIAGAVLGARWMAGRVRRRFNGLKVW